MIRKLRKEFKAWKCKIIKINRKATWCMLQYNKGTGKLFKIFKQMKNQGEANVEAYLHGLGIWRDLLFETKKKKKQKSLGVVLMDLPT